MEDGNKKISETSEPLSIVQEARLVRDQILRAKEELKAENDRKEKLQANELLSSSAGMHIEAQPKVETPKEYKDRIMRGG